MKRTSRIPGFYKLPVERRREEVARLTGLGADIARLADGPLLDAKTADHMVENVIGTHALPLGVGLNFQVNGKDYLVPMCVEEPSVIAASSNAAKMVRAGGGFTAEADDPIMIAQVQLTGIADTAAARRLIEGQRDEIRARADESQPGLVEHGGGFRDLEVRVLVESPAPEGFDLVDGEIAGGVVVVHLLVDCRDAMGANSVNTMAETVAPWLAELVGGQVGLRILSNLADRRRVRVRCRVPVEELASPSAHLDGLAVARGIVNASRFAERDPYRAATHNKGILNGIDPVVIACGNDWRGIEAGAHSFAARDGRYRPLSTWRLSPDHRFLEGAIELPMALGTVGGSTRVNAGVRLALSIVGVSSASELGMVAAAAGLASNLTALRALASEGINRGHMALHARTVARSVGAEGVLVERVAEELTRAHDFRPEAAAAVLARLQAEAVPPAADEVPSFDPVDWRRPLAEKLAPPQGAPAATDDIAHDQAAQGRTSFYYAFLFLPKAEREAIEAIYAYCRLVDDAVDEAASPEVAMARLRGWRGEIAAVFGEGVVRSAVGRRLREVVARFPVRRQDLEAVIEGCEWDATRHRYASWADLEAYCERVASSVGQMVIAVLGNTGEAARAYARDLGIALQLVNILRDVEEDVVRGRLYVPLEDLTGFGVSERDLAEGRRTPAVMRLLRFQAERARTHFLRARAALSTADRDRLVVAEIMGDIYFQLLEELERAAFPARRRVRLSTPRKAAVAAGRYLLAQTRLAAGRLGIPLGN